MVNCPLIRPYFLGGGGIGGVPLDSHEIKLFRYPFLSKRRRLVRKLPRFIDSSHDLCTGTSEGAVCCFLDLRKVFGRRKLGHLSGES